MTGQLDDDRWSVECAGQAIFVKYRGLDIAAVWLPIAGVMEANVTVPNEQAYRECETTDGNVEWSRTDERGLTLVDQMVAIDDVHLRTQFHAGLWREAVKACQTEDSFWEWQEAQVRDAKRKDQP